MNFKKINVPLTLFVLLSLRSLYMFDFAQAIAFACVTGIYAYRLHLDSKKVIPLDEEVRKEIEGMKNTLSNLSVKTGLKPPTNPEKKSYF